MACYSGIFQTALGVYLYLYKFTSCWISEGFVIKPMTSGMAGLFCIYNNLGLMLHNSNAEKHQVSFNSIMQLPGLEITSVWLCSSGLRHLTKLQSRLQLSLRLSEGCAGLEGWFPRGLSSITRKVVLGVGGRS